MSKPKPRKPTKRQLKSEPPLTEVELLSGQRQKSESDQAVIACNDWLRLGAGRTLNLLLERYSDLHHNTPTQSLNTLKLWSKSYDWQARASAYDAIWEQRKTQEREAVLNYGLALDYERLRKLYRLAAMLEAQIYERGLDGVLHNIWLPDVKSIGSGEFAERVDIERFNAPLLEQYRKVLDDIAQETGGRTKHMKVDDWRSQAIADIKAGNIAYEALAGAFDDSLASELFRAAGVPIPTSEGDSQ
jgi:hypothetical protein